jgi:hypothetical protein
MDVTPAVAEMALQLAVCAFAAYLLGCVVRHFWQTRRQPVRRDAPTGEQPWITPTPRHPND